VCARLRDGQPQVSIVVLTTFLDQKLLVGALQRGASGYALKDVDTVELARIIRTVHRGESGFDGRSARLVVRSLTGQPAAPARLLSERELEVVRLVARGATNVQAARDLYVSESTIKYHLRLAMRKLGAKDRTELVYRASAQGLLLGDSARMGRGPCPYGSSSWPGWSCISAGRRSDARPART
jgi:DNA-binding NarL/FixJ family response regulator